MQVGTRVQCRNDGEVEWCPGTISAVHKEDGTYNIVYDDGDEEDHVDPELCRQLLDDNGYFDEDSSAAKKRPVARQAWMTVLESPSNVVASTEKEVETEFDRIMACRANNAKHRSEHLQQRLIFRTQNKAKASVLRLARKRSIASSLASPQEIERLKDMLANFQTPPFSQLDIEIDKAKKELESLAILIEERETSLGESATDEYAQFGFPPLGGSGSSLKTQYDAIEQKLIEMRVFSTGMISYENFLAVRDTQPPHIQSYFSAATFLHFPRDAHGRINSKAFLRYVMRLNSLKGIATTLLANSISQDGQLTEQDLEDFLVREIEEKFSIPPGLPSPDFNFYRVIATGARLFFGLDLSRKRQVPIQALLESRNFSQFLALLENGDEEPPPADAHIYGPFVHQPGGNWFAAANMTYLYKTFYTLDKDRNGYLCFNELRQFGKSHHFDSRRWQETTHSPLSVSR